MQDFAKKHVTGHVLIRDKVTNEILLDKFNAIHPENMSVALAKSLANKPDGHIAEMHFGNGAATVSGTGVITYLPPNVTGSTADLYNPTYYKNVDDTSSLNTDPIKNYMQINHTLNTTYTDIVITCTLDFGEPVAQDAFDTATALGDNYIFNELGLKTFNSTPGTGLLITHVVFSPIQKSLNRIIEVVYTLRIQTV